MSPSRRSGEVGPPLASHEGVVALRAGRRPGTAHGTRPSGRAGAGRNREARAPHRHTDSGTVRGRLQTEAGAGASWVPLLLSRSTGLPIALLGDLVLDEFAYGEIARVSREAPVLILDYRESRFAPGGGANAATNLAALGARVHVVGRVGRDEAGDRILSLLENAGIDRAGIVRDDDYRTPVKTRILAGDAHTSKQQVVRIDKGPVGQPLSRATAGTLLSRLHARTRRSAALLIADYDFGAASPSLFEASRARPPVVTLDSRFRVLAFRGVTAATPNVAEVEQALDVRLPDRDGRALTTAGAKLRRVLGAQAVVITRGSRGMSLFERGKKPVHLPPFGSDEVADVTGAGDTVISAFTLALAAGASFPQATSLANVAGGLVVMKRGTATVSAEEILGALGLRSRAPGVRRSRSRGR